MRAIDLLSAIKHLIMCDHPGDARVSAILEGDHVLQCTLCGAWKAVSAADVEPWWRPAHLVHLSASVLEFADEALSLLSDEPPRILHPGPPAPPASETRMAAAEAERAAKAVLGMMFAPAAAVEAEGGVSMVETVRCLALCVEQLSAYQEMHRGKNVPVGFHAPELWRAGRLLRTFLRVLEDHQERLAKAKRAG